MLAHITAIKALLTAHTAYDTAAPANPPMPYYLVWGPGGTPGVEQAVDDVRLDIDAMIGVTTVAANPTAVRVAQGQSRGVLAPGGHAVALTVTGRAAWLRLFDSQPIEPDNAVTLPDTGHPCYGVDMYRLISTPSS